MPAVLPLEYTSLAAYTNLPASNSRTSSIYDKHEQRVLLFMEKYMTEDNYEALTSEDGSPTDALTNAGEFAFSRLCLSVMLPILNLNTAGEGVITSIGMDNHNTKLLSGKELKEKQIELNREALESIADYLNDDGAVLLASYKERPKRFFRSTLITQTEDDPDDDLWDDINIWSGY